MSNSLPLPGHSSAYRSFRNSNSSRDVSSWVGVAENLLERRVEKGCMLPTPAEILESAVSALKESAENLSGPGLFCMERVTALSRIRDNTIPETIITTCMGKDNGEEFRRGYIMAARRVIEGLNMTRAGIWQIMIKNYWTYLKTSSGTDMTVDSRTPSSLKVMLLWSTFSGKRLSKQPFKHSKQNDNHEALISELKRVMITLEKYAYYMRPDDPMSKSTDTMLRLHEILAYVSVSYRWLLWFMDLLDNRVLCAMDKKPIIRHGPRESQSPRDFIQRHLTSGPGISSGTGEALLLSAETANALATLLRISSMWSYGKWSTHTHGVTSTIVAALEMVTQIHLHLQYFINLVFGGYMCWAEGGMEDSYIRSALRLQGRFNHYIGAVIPVMSALTWSGMEKSVSCWFKYSLAKSLIGHVTPTQHYLGILGSIERGRRRSTRERAKTERRCVSQMMTHIDRQSLPLPSPPTPHAHHDVTYPPAVITPPNPYMGMASLLASPLTPRDISSPGLGDHPSNTPDGVEGCFHRTPLRSDARTKQLDDRFDSSDCDGTPYTSLDDIRPEESEDHINNPSYGLTETFNSSNLSNGDEPRDAYQTHYQHPRCISPEDTAQSRGSSASGTTSQLQYTEHYQTPICHKKCQCSKPGGPKGDYPELYNECGDVKKNLPRRRSSSPGIEEVVERFRPRSRLLDDTYGIETLATLNASSIKRAHGTSRVDFQTHAIRK
ncbi:tegument protein VP11/12 [Felid alphaherpesvirus 1]|uniref:Tegument protein UL46 homolog n=2 Tax=Feline herpesvirus 1 TaxID=10334 RepID=D1FXT6_FHV1|nr:tegument protein VP11/12 [Felid alphaherpesvirus 1]AMN88944.1 tegument protein VP11/12 [synthetic construct]ACT88312.2 tegument protein VP11/12 [Felid alphaherpesvirus 1]ALJ84072.1 tegument protein VP11/12 [Felid alphaherpesvirus 1]ALJ84148.1 tegument protein VP11/12 [Felid alphaherpesvirus 1]ALJ84224.1 tegument protein VP11/12 [Felid alphaherpesvirus 1]